MTRTPVPPGRAQLSISVEPPSARGSAVVCCKSDQRGRAAPRSASRVVCLRYDTSPIDPTLPNECNHRAALDVLPRRARSVANAKRSGAALARGARAEIHHGDRSRALSSEPIARAVSPLKSSRRASSVLRSPIGSGSDSSAVRSPRSSAFRSQCTSAESPRKKAL